MNRRNLITSMGTLVGAAAGIHHAHAHPVAGDAHSAAGSSALLEETANRFLAALDEAQRAKAVFPFDSDERMDWHFIPKERKGLPLREMQPYQKHLASALLSAGLSQAGYIKAVTIMSLEDVLRIMEKDSGEHRNPEKYYFSIFGTPSGTAPWGYRVEGHHVSQNYTIVNGQVTDGPSFFGSNPAEVRQGPRKGLRTLAREDDLGLDLMRSLDLPLRKIAIVDPVAYKDILTAASRQAALSGQPSGLPAARMNAKQFDALMALAHEYAVNVPGSLADRRKQQIARAGKDIHFAWSGGINAGDARYYRVQAPSFLIEFDDTQDAANHIHSVWRDFNGDFGADLLKLHYQTGHAGKGHAK
ncbi:MAG TPA: DUF3500 domain-containing protein [Bryobacteraceae bacterium]|nr:DUF3500 domain-containing protein [Bryobacteraceae bacterium]